MIRLLLQAGARLEAFDRQGWTPFEFAITCRQPALATELLRSRAQVSSGTIGNLLKSWSYGKTYHSYHEAQGGAWLSLLQKAVKKGADVNVA